MTSPVGVVEGGVSQPIIIPVVRQIIPRNPEGVVFIAQGFNRQLEEILYLGGRDAGELQIVLSTELIRLVPSRGDGNEDVVVVIAVRCRVNCSNG